MTPLFTLLIQLIVIVAVGRAAGMLFQRLGQPAVVGEMAAGLALGPSLLGRLAPGVSAALFPPASLETLSVFSQFGLVLYMFLVGSRLDVGHLRANGRVVLATGYASILVPLACGIVLGLGLADRFGPATGQLAFVLFVGLSLSITAFPVLVRIVKEHQLDATRLGTVAVACAAFNDVTAWVALALVTSLAATGQVSIAAALLPIAVYAGVMWVGVRPALAWWLRRPGRAPLEEGHDVRVTLLLLAALGSAAATERLGIHALFGAFFLGALMSPAIAEQRIDTSRMEPLAVALFLPLFFAFTGLRTNVFLLDSPGLLLQTAGIVALAAAAKAGAPFLLARRFGFPRREAAALGLLLNTRGLVELVVLNIGLETGLLPPPLFTMLTLMALLTTAMTSPGLKILGYPRRLA